MAAHLSVPEFVARWKNATLTERSAAQSHFNDLCDALGQPHPTAADPDGTFYTFEKGVKKTAGGKGFADVWLRGHFGWEYKGPHKDLRAAYQQLLQYCEDLENPPLLVVSDLNRFEVHTKFTGTVKRVYAFTLDDLLCPTPTPGSPLPPLDVLRSLFANPEHLRPQQTTEQVTQAAAAEFATLSESLRRRGVEPERAAHFLMRLLFCLFAEDIGLLPRQAFALLVKNWQSVPSRFTDLLSELFRTMASGGAFGPFAIQHFNGGLFADNTALDLTPNDMQVLLRATELDWASIEPAIFGTLFERSLDPAKRAQLGAHYTSRGDIELIVEPVLMAPLRRRWDAVRQQAEALVARRDAASGGARTTHERALIRLLLDFDAEIARVRVLDPACGSGNFLYVALKRLLDFEKEIVVFAAANRLTQFFPSVDPAQLYGIEVSAYAHELAQIVVWIGYLQWLHDNGFGIPGTPILRPLHNIERRDAILDYDAAWNPVEPEWPEADVIIGNPPFLGDKKMRTELGDEYVEQVRTLYEGRVPGGADLVCYWFEKARAAIEAGRAKRAGLLATQAIRGGANRRVLEQIKASGDIFYAQADRPWVLDGAAVRVSMVGFDAGHECSRFLNDLSVETVNADLTGNTDLTKAGRLIENTGISFIGVSLHGPFGLSEAAARAMLAQPPNPNGRPNSDVVSPLLNGIDVTRRPRHVWVVDFGVDMSLEDASLYEMPFEYVRTNVKPVRDQNRRQTRKIHWWRLGETMPSMRNAFMPLQHYIATPRIAKHRVFVRLPVEALPTDQLVTFAREDDYFFGVLQSKPQELWALRLGTALEDRPRYTPSTTFETFPFPWPPGQEPTADPRVREIAAAAQDLVAKRDTWLNPTGASEADLKDRTLTNLYNQRPTWLDLAHRRIDVAVLDAYGWPSTIADHEILERLLALNLQRAGVVD